jgi:hypothetical protein
LLLFPTTPYIRRAPALGRVLEATISPVRAGASASEKTLGGKLMNRRMVLQLVFHGLLLIVLGMLVGFAFHSAITEQAGPDAERAWRVAHTSLVGLGALYLALAGVARHIVLSRGAARFTISSLLFAAYASILGFVVGPVIGARGLEPVGPPLHVFIFGALALALVLLLVAMIVLLAGAFAALRAPRTDD